LRAEEAVREGKERERLHQVELLQISRLSTLGEMASGLAHELNQPLCAIQSCADLCLRAFESKVTENNKIRENLETIEGQAERAGNVVRRVKTFAKKKEPNRDTIDISDLVREVLAFVDSDIRNNGIIVSIELSDRAPPVLADRVQIEQVLVNLIRNAIEAMAEVEQHKRNLAIEISQESDAMIKFTVRDTGKGLTPEVRKHLFDPFFTTKADGLGIGLSITHTIIEAHNGELWAASNPEGQGSSLVFTLPISETKV
jgi:two-component system sensor histidine kinase TtrS